MKSTVSCFLLMLMSLSSLAQDNKIVKISEDACAELKNVPLNLPKEERYTLIKETISNSILYNEIIGSLTSDTKKALDSLQNIGEFKSVDSLTLPGTKNIIVLDENYEEVEEYLLRNCDTMKDLMTNQGTSSEVSISDKKKALEFYDKGLNSFKLENYEEAIKNYKKALRKDSNFAFAWDMLGYSYRRLENYEEAIKAYDKSLDLDPKGRMPLMNKPIAFELMGDIDQAIIAYGEFIEVFPGDPEGLYGIGRVYHLKGDYEQALELTIQALIGYSKINSPYANDAKANLGLYYRELKEKGQMEIWDAFAKKYNINIED